jgi:hypothetical protein
MKEAGGRIRQHTCQIQKVLTAMMQRFAPASNQAKKLELTNSGIISLDLALKSNRIGYIDPTSEWSTRQLRCQLAALERVPRENLNLGVTGNCNMYTFTQNLASFAIEELPALDGYLTFAQHDMNSIAGADTALTWLKSHAELLIDLVGDEKAAIDQAIVDRSDKIFELNARTEVLHEIPLHKKCGFLRGWWRQQRVTLEEEYKDVRVWTVVEDLSPHTHVAHTYANSTPDFDVLYESDLGHDLSGRIVFYVESRRLPPIGRKIRQLDVEMHSLQQRGIELVASAESSVKQDIDDIWNAYNRVMELYRGGGRESVYRHVEDTITFVYGPEPPPFNLAEFTEKVAVQRHLALSNPKRPIQILQIPALGSSARHWRRIFESSR